MKSLVKNWEELENHLGFSPTLGDDEVIKFELERDYPLRRNQRVRMTVISFGPKKPTKIEFSFNDVTDLKLEDFNHQNTISELSFEKKEDLISVVMGTAHGLFFSLKCREASVERVETINE